MVNVLTVYAQVRVFDSRYNGWGSGLCVYMVKFPTKNVVRSSCPLGNVHKKRCCFYDSDIVLSHKHVFPIFRNTLPNTFILGDV